MSADKPFTKENELGTTAKLLYYGAGLCSFISVGETPTSISGEMKHISLSGGYNPPTEIKPDRGLQECAEEDVSKADAHSAARTLERS